MTEPNLTDDEIEEILGTMEERYRSDMGPRLAPLPDAAEMADAQHMDACHRLALDTGTFPRFPWPDVDAMVGPLAPSEMVFLLGRPGQGKSLFLQNVTDALVEQGRRVLYIGTEQNPEILKIKWGCLRAGVSTRLALKATAEQRGSTDYRLAMERLAGEMESIRQWTRQRLAMFATSKYVNRPELDRWVRGGVRKYGVEVVIVDHIDEMEHGDGNNPRHENTQTLNLIQQLAKELGVRFLIASQCRRTMDRVQLFTPPSLEDLAENNNKERKASYVLGVWRPLCRGVTDDQLKKVRLGMADESLLYERDEMGVKALKVREDTGELGKSCRLRLARGRLLHIPERDRYGTIRIH